MDRRTTSNRELARWIGVSETAVRRAERAGRIRREADGSWDLARSGQRGPATPIPASSGGPGAAADSLLALQREAGSPAERRLLTQAIAAVRESLRRAPAEPRGWMRLAQFQTLRDGPRRASAEALLLSLRTGPYERVDFLTLRLYLGLLHWDLYGAAERNRLRRQLELVWDEAPAEIMELAFDPEIAPALDAALRALRALRAPFVEALQLM